MSGCICCVRHVFILSLVSMHAIAHAGNLERGNTFVFVETPNSWLQPLEEKTFAVVSKTTKLAKKFYLLKIPICSNWVCVMYVITFYDTKPLGTQ